VRPDPFILAALIAGSGWAVWSQLKQDPAPAVAPVQALAIGEAYEDFALKDPTGELHAVSKWKGRVATVLYFWSIDCPCVDRVELRMRDLIERYEPRGVSFVAIDSHPDDAPKAAMEKLGKLYIESPKPQYRLLLDPTGKVARAVGGRTSTDIVVLDADWKVRYRGAIDDDLMKPTKPYLSVALDALLAGRSPEVTETTPYGCPYPGLEGVCPVEDSPSSKPESPPSKNVEPAKPGE
jgi:peroxiredoxin